MSAECARHGAFETWVLTLAGREFPGRCPQCAAEQLAAQERAERAQQGYRMLAQAQIPPRYIDRSFDNYRAVNAKAKAALRACENYVECFEERRRHGGGLILCGRPGTGKTHLACAIARRVIELYQREVLYSTVASAVRSVKQTYAPGAQASETDALRRFQQPDLLILDEVGMQRGTDYEVLLIGEVIAERYASVLPTILVSNHTPAELTQFIGARAADRMREGGGVALAFEWESYRPQVEGDENLSWPGDEHANQST